MTSPLIQTDHILHGWPPTRCNFAWKAYAYQYDCQAWLIPIHVRGI
jgi:hypothetical protein